VRALLAVLLLSGSAWAQKTVTLTWTPGSNPGWNCVNNVYCLTGFTLYEQTSGAPVAVANAPQTSTSLSFTPPPAVGPHVYDLVQNGINGSGKPVQSADNPSIVITCWKNSYGRMCSVGKAWK
jgi:hypothetical protein